MKTTFSERERYGIFVLFSVDWGGGEEALLLRDEAYEALRLSAFEGIRPTEVKKGTLSDAQAPFHLNVPVAEYLRAVIAGQPGQSRELGRMSAMMVRRLRAAIPPPKPKGKDQAP